MYKTKCNEDCETETQDKLDSTEKAIKKQYKDINIYQNLFRNKELLKKTKQQKQQKKFASKTCQQRLGNKNVATKIYQNNTATKSK